MDKKDQPAQREQVAPEQENKELIKPVIPEPPLDETNDDEGADGLDDGEAEETGDELRGK